MRFRRFRFRLFVKDEYQPLRLVPKWLWLALTLSFSAQLGFHAWLPPPKVDERGLQLQTPSDEVLLRALAFGDPAPLSRVLMLNLQAFDNQQGVSILYTDLDYTMLGLWLDRIVALDEKSEYPHFTAAKIYTGVQDESRQRQMVEWVRKQFRASPDTRWEWMAHVTNFIRYRLEDQELSLEMAHELRDLTTPGKTPGWARQTAVFFLESENEYQASANLLANLLAEGEVTDPAEFSFLLDRLEEIVLKMVSEGKIKNQDEFNQIQNQMDDLREQFLQQHGESLNEES